MARADDHYREDWRMKCPYYCKEGDIEIRCLGIIGTHVTHTFSTKADKNEHKYDFCNGTYMGCPVYQMLWEEM